MGIEVDNFQYYSDTLPYNSPELQLVNEVVGL